MAMNCMNVCLANGLLTVVDTYAEKAGLPRDEVVQKLIDMAVRECDRKEPAKWKITYMDGQEYLVMDNSQFRIPPNFDASSNMFIAVAAPTGGLGNFPALVQGECDEGRIT